MALKIFTIFWKNLEIIFNSKLSSLILILGPIFLILISGSALQDTSLRNIKLGVFLEEENEFTNEFLNSLRERSFAVNVEGSLKNCRDNVVNSLTQGCLELRTAKVDIPSDINKNVYYDIELSVDFSKQRIVWSIISSVITVVDSENRRIRETAISGLNENLDLLVSDIKQREAGLNSAISRSKLLEEKLDNLDDNIEELKDEKGNLAEVQSEISAAKGEITILSQYLEAGLNGTYGYYSGFTGLFSLIDSSVGRLNESINNANEKFNYGTIINSLDNMDVSVAILHNEVIKQDLLKSKRYLGELKIDLEDIKNIDIERASDPISLSYKSASNVQEEGSIEDKLTFLDYLFPSFVMLFLLLASIVFSATSVIRERASKAHTRNVTSKTSGFTFIFSNFMTSFFLIFIQIALLFFVASFFLNLSIVGSLFSIFIAVAISIALFVLMGLVLGYIFNSQETTIIASISVGLLFIIFSPLVAPVETLPASIARIVNLSPLVLLETKLRQSLIFGIPFNLPWSGIISLILITVVLSALIALFYHVSKKKEI